VRWRDLLFTTWNATPTANDKTEESAHLCRSFSTTKTPYECRPIEQVKALTDVAANSSVGCCNTYKYGPLSSQRHQYIYSRQTCRTFVTYSSLSTWCRRTRHHFIGQPVEPHISTSGPTTKTQTTGVLMDTAGDKVAALNRRWKTASEC